MPPSPARRPRSLLRGLVLCALLGCAALQSPAAVADDAAAVRCWRGWGYWIDPASRAYLGEELLLVTRGDVAWGADRPITLYQLDRASGMIAGDRAPIVVVPPLPRARYNGQVNYVDGLARVQGREQHLVFGMSEILPATSPLPRAAAFNRSMCGLG